MSLKDYFRDELKFLKEEGKEFAKAFPHLTNFLSDEAVDPDIERLLEGFSFLSARLRQKIDDDFPELTHSILNLLWPNYLRPVPSCTIMQFEPKDKSTTHKQVLEKGTEVQSCHVDGQQCIFTTCADLEILPLKISEVESSNTREKSVVALQLNSFSGQPLHSIECNQISIHLAGDDYTALTSYLWLFNYLDKINFVFDDKIVTANQNIVKKQGFDPEEALLPYPKNVFDGYRILQEFFSFPRRFYFVKLTDLQKYWPCDDVDSVKVELHFSRSMPDDIQIKTDDFKLHCIPAVNLFKHPADPIDLNGKRVKYKLKPSGKEENYEIFSVDKVIGMDVDKATLAIKGHREYSPFETFQHEIERSRNRTALYYRTQIKNRIDETSFSHDISFVRGDEVEFFSNSETISAELSCTNRNLPQSLAVGDICLPKEETPSFVEFRNITKPTRNSSPVLDGGLHWILISNFSLNYLSLLKVELLQNVIRSYDFLAMHDLQAQRRTAKRLNAISDIETNTIDILFKGFPVRGIKSLMSVDGNQYICEGELFLFGTVLAHFFNLYSSINSFHILEVFNQNNNETYSWDVQMGAQPVI